MLAGQQPLHLEPSAQVVAGEHELRGLAGRQHAAVVLAPHAAELRQVAPVRQVLGDELSQGVRSQMRYQGQQDEHGFVR